MTRSLSAVMVNIVTMLFVVVFMPSCTALYIHPLDCTTTLPQMIAYYRAYIGVVYPVDCTHATYSACQSNWNGAATASTYIEGCCGSSSNMSFSSNTPICAAGYYSGVIPATGGKFTITTIPDLYTCAVIPPIASGAGANLSCQQAIDRRALYGDRPWYIPSVFANATYEYYWYENFTNIACTNFTSLSYGYGYWLVPVLQCVASATGLEVHEQYCRNASEVPNAYSEQQCIPTTTTNPLFTYFEYQYAEYGACVDNIQRREYPACKGYFVNDTLRELTPIGGLTIKPDYLCAAAAWNRPSTMFQYCADDDRTIHYVTIGVSFFLLFACIIIFHARYYKPNEKAQLWEDINHEQVKHVALGTMSLGKGKKKSFSLDVDTSGLKNLVRCQIDWPKFWRDMQVNHPVISALYPSRYDPHNRWRRILSLFFLLGIHFDIAGAVVVITLDNLDNDQSNLSIYSMLLSTGFSLVVQTPCEMLVVYLGRGKPGIRKSLAYVAVVILSFALPAGLIYFCLNDTWRPYIGTIFLAWLSSVSLSWIIFGFKQMARSLFCAKKQTKKVNDHILRYSMTPIPRDATVPAAADNQLASPTITMKTLESPVPSAANTGDESRWHVSSGEIEASPSTQFRSLDSPPLLTATATGGSSSVPSSPWPTATKTLATTSTAATIATGTGTTISTSSSKDDDNASRSSLVIYRYDFT